MYQFSYNRIFFIMRTEFWNHSDSGKVKMFSNSAPAVRLLCKEIDTHFWHLWPCSQKSFAHTQFVIIYVQVYSNSNVGKKGSEKNIVRPQEVQNSWFLVKWSMTHYTLRSVFFRAHPTPPICLKTPKCAIFSPSLAFHFKNHPKVGVYREKF